MPTYDGQTAELLVFTYKAGLLSKIAHDLKLRVETFLIDVDAEAPSLSLQADAASLRVVCAIAGGRDDFGALSRRDRREIEATIAGEILQAARYPTIDFETSAVDGACRLISADEARIGGPLRLHGRQQTIVVTARRQEQMWVATARLSQPDFGIRPYTAMLGSLRIKPEITVRVQFPC